jgi:aldehyde dehydrogenase (NAD+)/betaine-aldehyde dehydrogenase
LRVAEAVRGDAEALAELESRDTGKPLSQARTDVEVAADYFEFYGGFADKHHGDTIPLNADNLALTLREPMGVTAHIVPWNYPLQIGARTVAASLMAGNACVVKPAEEAPLTLLRLAVLAEEAGLARGLLNVVPGVGTVAGAALAASDGVDHISFTGGTETGRAVMTAAATNLKPLTMELGGKSPSIVLADADLDRAVPVIVRALIQNSGQTCSAGTRVIVDTTLHDTLVTRLLEAFGSLRLGPGSTDPDVGPLITKRQLERVRRYLDIAADEGAEIRPAGVDVPAEGYFVEPVVLVGVAPRMRVAQEEIFGPVLSVISCDGVREAVSIADATPFGLVTAVWSENVDEALWAARNVSSGQVYINSYGAGGGVPLPFGGYKRSGFGREKGLEALHEYTQVKTIAIDVRPPVPLSPSAA